MSDEALEAACKEEGLTDGQRRAREFVVANQQQEAAKARFHDAYMELRLQHDQDEVCILVAQALDDLGLEPVGDYVETMMVRYRHELAPDRH